MLKKKQKQQALFHPYKVYSLLLLSILVTCVTTYILYINTQKMFRWSLEQKLTSIASVASAEFDPIDLDQITDHDSYKKEIYKQVVLKLQRLRNHASRVKFMYILRRTNDPNQMDFVADADSLNPNLPVDLNGDGKIDENDQLAYPGDKYDVKDFPEFRQHGFESPFVDPTYSNDQWGTYLSGTAPIEVINAESNNQYLIGIDVDVSDVITLTNLSLIPFALFIVLLLLILVTMTVFLRGMWKYQVELLTNIDRQKDELLSIVSHQLAAPITAIKWYLELLEDDSSEDERKKNIRTMHGITANLSDLVSMLLDVSRIQLGKMKPDKQEIALAEFFNPILQVVIPKAKESGVKFEHNVTADLPKAMLDKRLTRMTIENLLTNAIKYTPKDGTVTLHLEFKNDEMLCTVSDTGFGIPLAEQSKIFGKLYRASNVRDTVDGNGFGLYVAKGAIESQGGKLWFESAEGKGTTFYAMLPLK